MDKSKFQGILVPIIAPLTADGGVDLDAMEKVIRYAFEKGVDGLYVCGGTGDANYLRVEERKAIAERAYALCKEYGKTCIVHTGARATRDAVELVRHASALGVDAVSSMPPVKSNRLQRYAYYKALSDASGATPLIIYYIPGVAVDISFDEMLELLELKNVIGLKFSDPNFFYLKRLLERKPDILVYNGCDELLVYGMLCGADGGIGMNYNVFPELFVTMYKCCKNGDIVNAMKLQDALSHFLDPVFEYGLWESVEHTVELRFGMGMRCFREPNTIHVMTDAQKAVVAERMQYLDNVVAEVVADINK
jgi:N-acetylneuraminate lyase